MTRLYPEPAELYKHIHLSSSGVTAVSACFFFNATLRCQTESVIDRRIDLRWECHRSVLSIRVSAGIPLQNSPQCTQATKLSCNPLKPNPNALRLGYKAEN